MGLACPFLQLCGRVCSSNDVCIIIASGLFISLLNYLSTLGFSPSGPGELCSFKDSSLFFTSSSVIFSSSSGFLMSSVWNLGMLLVSSSVNTSLQCFCLFTVSCCLFSFNVQISNSSFGLQFAIDIAENSFRVPFSLFCQGAFKSLLCVTTLPACLIPSLGIFKIIIIITLFRQQNPK